MRYAPQNLITIATVASYVNSRVDSHNKRSTLAGIGFKSKW